MTSLYPQVIYVGIPNFFFNQSLMIVCFIMSQSDTVWHYHDMHPHTSLRAPFFTSTVV